MGKQYNKLKKRKRRSAYLARRKAELKLEKPASVKKVKKSTSDKETAPAKAVRKKAEPKAKSVVFKPNVAEKASTEDVLGPESKENVNPKDSSADEVSGS